jgi:hypothetical protein
MSASTVIRFALGVVILSVVAIALFTARAKRERRDLTLALSLSVGTDLVHSTTSKALTGVTAELQSDIKQIQASPAQAIIQAGDDDPPLGDGSASARMLLTNAIGQTLTLRLRLESEPGTGLRNFRVLGYRKTEPGGAANRGQPIGSETNRMPAASGPGG